MDSMGSSFHLGAHFFFKEEDGDPFISRFMERQPNATIALTLKKEALERKGSLSPGKLEMVMFRTALD